MYAGLSRTMEGFKARPLTTRRNIADATMDQVIEALEPARKAHKDICEETVLYYLHSHAQHLIEGRRDPTEELPDEEAKVLEMGYRERSQIAMRMFYYLLKITGEEGQFGTARSDSLFEYVEEQTSVKAAEWLRTLMTDRKPHIPTGSDIKLGDTVRACLMGFDYATWSSGYGGARWAAVSQTLDAVVHGRTTLELMVDNAFTLCHNNGTIFNKGHNYTQCGREYYPILDVQASGQIPNIIHQGRGILGITPRVKEVWAAYAELFPEEFKAPYDERKVKSMEGVRTQKEAALQKSAQAKNAAHSAQPVAPKGPPPRTSDGIDDMMSSLVTGQDFGSLVSSASKKIAPR